MTGWIYVLELAPSGRIKVGKTGTLHTRLKNHTDNAQQQGGSLAAVFAIPSLDPDTSEHRLLQALPLRGGVLVHGKETFEGLAFSDTVDAATEIVRTVDESVLRVFSKRTSVSGSPPADMTDRRPATPTTDPIDLLEDVRKVMDAEGVTRAHLTELREALSLLRPGIWGHLDNDAIGAMLRQAGVPVKTVWSRAAKKDGKGVKREWLDGASQAA